MMSPSECHVYKYIPPILKYKCIMLVLALRNQMNVVDRFPYVNVQTVQLFNAIICALFVEL